MKALTDFLNEGNNYKTGNPNRDDVVKWIDENYIYTGLKISDKPYKYSGMYEVAARDVEVKNKNITSLTNGMFVWTDVSGNFLCNYCKKLTSLKGAPEEVGKTFSCRYCDSLKSLEGAPRQVGDNFYCLHCKSLVSLNDGPDVVGNHFDCAGCNSLMSLEGSPLYVGGYFDCSECGINFTENDVKIISKVKGKIIC